MARKLRIQYPGAIHVMNRGDLPSSDYGKASRREAIFEDDEDRQRLRRKGEARKIELAWELRSQTTMPLAWIAERLNMGTREYLAWLLRHRGESRLAAPADRSLLRI
jgi:hypothetical protein